MLSVSQVRHFIYIFQTFKGMADVDSVVPILQMKKQRLRETG